MPVRKVKLHLCFDDSSPLALSIPLAQCTTFAIAPLKWLRFLGFVIYGRRGYLSMSKNGPEPLDYTAQIQARPYYFISDGEPRFADVDALDYRTSSASDFSTGRVDFRDKIIERDGTCVLTGVPPVNCDACHFIPHSKGDNYMPNLFNHRREAYGLVDTLDDINDTRNGILLHVSFHRALNAGVIAFLKTPNFALTVDDIPYHQHAGSPANRFTLQYIQPLAPEIDAVLRHLGPHNSDAQLPQDTSKCPHTVILDLCYATAVLRAWGPKPFIEYLLENSKDYYYGSDDDGDGDEDEDGGGGGDENPQGDSTRQTSRQNQRVSRPERYERRCANKAQAVNRTDQPTFDDMDMFDMVLALWKRPARGGEGPPGNDAAAVADNANKIQTWLQSVEESTS